MKYIFILLIAITACTTRRPMYNKYKNDTSSIKPKYTSYPYSSHCPHAGNVVVTH